MSIHLDPAKLKAARQAAKLTQAELAEALGGKWNRSLISDLEQARVTDISQEELNALAHALGVASVELTSVAHLAEAIVELNTVHLRAARQAARLTQAELAEKTGFSQSALANLEAGRRGTSLEGVQALATALNVSVKYLLGVAEAPAAPESDPQAAILQDGSMPASLRNLAADTVLLKPFAVRPDEWRTLQSIALQWRDAELAPKEGWLAILAVMRAMMPR